jgi:pimeloyl-ACP methyl ester carboxylesterase
MAQAEAHDRPVPTSERMATSNDFARQLLLSVGVTFISRACLMRDWLLGRTRRRGKGHCDDAAMMRHWIPSGSHRLDAVLVTPIEGTAQATLLICHGIGETVDTWLPVQRMLALQGVASLVFDYAGYGRSTGFFHATQAGNDTVAAFDWLREVALGAPISVLGFSLGSGIVTSALSRISPRRLTLCAAFTSLREAIASCGTPGFLALLAPPIWQSVLSLKSCKEPVLIVHGEKDELFPVQMARELAAACPLDSRLLLVPGLAHDEPHRLPTLDYWMPIITYVTGK